MIAVRPNSPAFAVLALVVDLPGELDADTIAAHLARPMRWEPEAGPLAERLASLRAHVAAKEAARRAHAAEVSRLLGRLQEAGFVEKRGPPRVAAWFAERVARFGLGEALRREHPAWPGKVPSLRAHRALLRKVESLPRTARDLMGERPSGTDAKAYRELVEWGVLVSPSMRWPTPAGVALVAEGGRASA